MVTNMRRILSFVIALLSIALVDSMCPNACSGHGKCTRDNACVCDDGYKVVADCSQMSCPKDVAWVDKAWGDTVTNLAHSTKGQECSKMGTCDRKTGKCKCYPGYEGQACQREECHCSDNGICMTLHDIYDAYSL